MKNLSVEMVNYEGLPDEIEKEGLSDNGAGKEYATYLLIWHNKKLLECQSDAMEPEDARFSRDLNWIASAIERAYDQGKTDAKNGAAG